MSREPRDRALQRLYEADIRGRSPDWEGLPPKSARFVEGVWREQQALDQTLDDVSEGWRLSRMPAVDRAILRIGLFELRHEPTTPTAVVVSEAVRMAKTFSTERSGAFVNGVLAELARRERAEN